MNKKLFSWKALAGVALLAAVSFTSCNSDTPIDSSNPSGVTPTAVKHSVGGDYDWTVAASNVAEFDKFWAEDADAVKKLIGTKSVGNICIVADNFTLENGKAIVIPNLWGAADAKGKVINVAVTGKFKNADFERADAIKNAANPTKQTKFPVQFDTDKVGGSEVNFAFDAEQFDLELSSPKTRSNISGDFTIGYLKAVAAEKLSAMEFKSGTVEGLDYASTGDFKGEIAGVWVRNTPAAPIEATANGIKVGQNASYTVFGKNVFVEADVTLDTWYKNSANKNALYTLGTVKYVKAATVTLGGTDKDGNLIGSDGIENLVGYKADDCILQVSGNTDLTDLANIGAIEKVTVQAAPVLLLADVYTDVVFKSNAIFTTETVTAFDKVEFNGGLDIFVHANNTALTFNAVKFGVTPTIASTIEVENTVATTATKTYQWIIDDAAANKGHYEECAKNDFSDLKEYNKDKEVGKYAYNLGSVKCKATKDGAGVVTFSGDDAAAATKYNVIQISITTPAGKITLIPEGVTVTMDKDCKFFGATTDAALNQAWGNKNYWDEQCWYTVSYADVNYIWKKSTAGYPVLYVLVKPAE